MLLVILYQLLNLLLQLFLRYLTLQWVRYVLLTNLSRLIVFTRLILPYWTSEVLVGVIGPVLLILAWILDDAAAMIVVFCPARCRSLKVWDVVLSHWLLVMMISILLRVILTWIYRASPTSMALVILLVAWSFLEWLSLLIVDLAITVARHNWTLLVGVTEFVRILVTWSNAFLNDGIVAIYAVRHDWGSHILDAWVAHVASVLVPTACWTSSSRNGLVLLLANSEFE
jgi:hypothetical protein